MSRTSRDAASARLTLQPTRRTRLATRACTPARTSSRPAWVVGHTDPEPAWSAS